jgi:Zn-dependent M28 family amino/carboxypeptidase
VGVGAPVDGDSIYNGADDNASGTAALLELAEHLAHLPAADRPARSVLFVWHAAEEAGLLGSEHFTDNPTVSRQAMVGHINMDMVGRNHPDSLFVIGSRRLSTEFGDWLDELNARLDRPFILDYTFDAPNHPEMLYCRSDHWNFARYGIPSVMMGSGLHDDYHQPSDHADKIEYEKMRRVVELAAALTERVANTATRPRIDTPPAPLGTPCS